LRSAAFDVSVKPPNEEHISTMSANASSLVATPGAIDSTSGAFSWGRYARIGLLTISASVLANAVFFYLAQVAVPYDSAFLPLGNVSAPVIFTVFVRGTDFSAGVGTELLAMDPCSNSTRGWFAQGG